MPSIWEFFTKRYPLSKTLRFELKPVGKTEKLLKSNKVFEKDRTIDDSYNQAKFYFDMIHRDFIDSTLEPKKAKSIDFKNFARTFYEQNKIIKQKQNERRNLKDKKDRDDILKQINEAENKINDSRKNLYKQIRKIFDEESVKLTKFYKERKNNKDKGENQSKNKEENNKNKTNNKIEKSILFSKEVLNILKDKFPKEKDKEFQEKDWPSLYVENKANSGQKEYIFDSFEKFTTYLTKFQQTRKNLYADNGESTSVISRIVSNFEIFLKNKEVFREKYSLNYKKIGFPRIDIFKNDYYFNCLTQKGIEILEDPSKDEISYNKIIGKINKKIKEYRDKNKIEKRELPLFRKLEKQILGKVEKEKELIQKTEDKSESEVFLERFKEFIEENEKRIPKAKEIINFIISGNFESEYDRIYLRREAINTISRRWFVNYQDFLLKLPQSSKSKEEKSEPKIKKFVSLEDIKNAISEMNGDIFREKYYKQDKGDQGGVILQEQDRWQQFLKIWQYEFNGLFKDKKEGEEIIYYGYNNALEQTEKLKSFSKKKEEISIVKNYCDSALKIYQMMKYFDLGDKDKKGAPSDFSTEFYAQFDEYYKDFQFIKYYNAFRNYLTKKPYSEEKIKLNFDCGQLLGGWDKNKEKEKLGIMLRKNGLYYLGIINPQHRDIFDEKKHKEIYDIDSKWEKMDYKFIGDAKKQISHIAFAKQNKNKFGLSEEICDIKTEYDKFQKKKQADRELWNKQFDKNKKIKLIDYYQRVLELNNYKEIYNLSWEKPEKYRSLVEFYNDIKKQGYRVKFRKISDNYIASKVNNGELYLFRIYNKDFAKGATGVKNIHTFYFLNLFTEENLNNPILKLNGNAEIFYRESSLSPQKKFRGIYKKREVIEYKRYTEPKILFHIPISINFNATDAKLKKFNQEINKFLAENKNKINIIGIDRGEKNLLYYCVINQRGQILEQKSLNEINNVNYFEKLIEREKERQLNRQSWQPVAKIKNLKKGYISYAVKKICDLIEKYNAIVVLEDLNMRFKQIRSGIERAVYQQFEKALIDKLNYLVFKDNRDVFAPGGILNGYQLSAPFVSFKKMGKQTGVIFYTNAEYTSKTDPLTGFRQNIYISNSSSSEKIKGEIGKIKAIGWDIKEKSYFFTYNPADFHKDVLSKEWTIYSKIPRIRREKNKNGGYWEYKKIDLNKEFQNLFEKYGFETEKQDILSDIKDKIKTDDKSLMEKKEFDDKLKNFYERFIYLFNLILQIRNTCSLGIKIGEKNNKLKEIDYGIDFIASPVKPFFTTIGVRKINNEIKEEFTKNNFAEFEKVFGNSKEAQENKDQFDSDGVGAYNIARKGIMILDKISRSYPRNPDLYITKAEWDKFVIK